jgi:hypothetical protein
MVGLEVMLASPPADDAAAMERHGVIPPFTVCIEEVWRPARASGKSSYWPARAGPCRPSGE